MHHSPATLKIPYFSTQQHSGYSTGVMRSILKFSTSKCSGYLSIDDDKTIFHPSISFCSVKKRFISNLYSNTANHPSFNLNHFVGSILICHISDAQLEQGLGICSAEYSIQKSIPVPKKRSCAYFTLLIEQMRS